VINIAIIWNIKQGLKRPNIIGKGNEVFQKVFNLSSTIYFNNRVLELQFFSAYNTLAADTYVHLLDNTGIVTTISHIGFLPTQEESKVYYLPALIFRDFITIACSAGNIYGNIAGILREV